MITVLLVAFVFSVAVSNSTGCEEGWFQFRESCYFVSQKQLEHIKSFEDCFARKSELMSPDTFEELDKVLKAMVPKDQIVWVSDIANSEVLRNRHYDISVDGNGRPFVEHPLFLEPVNPTYYNGEHGYFEYRNLFSAFNYVCERNMSCPKCERSIKLMRKIYHYDDE